MRFVCRFFLSCIQYDPLKNQTSSLSRITIEEIKSRMMKCLLIIAVTACCIAGLESAACFSCFKPKVNDDDSRPPPNEPAPQPGGGQAPEQQHLKLQPKYERKLAEKYQDYFFDINSAENASPEVARIKMVYLRNSYKKGLIRENYERKELADRWYKLTQFTRCSKQNDNAFEDLILAYSEYRNFIALVKWERELYRKTCVEHSGNF